MSSPNYANAVSLGVDNPYITQPSDIPAPTSTAQIASAQEQDRPTDEPAPVVLAAPSKTERFFLTAADQASGSRNERLNMVIRSKYEAGLLKPYNYVKGYARLSRWMDRKYVPVSRLEKHCVLNASTWSVCLRSRSRKFYSPSLSCGRSSE